MWHCGKEYNYIAINLLPTYFKMCLVLNNVYDLLCYKKYLSVHEFAAGVKAHLHELSLASA